MIQWIKEITGIAGAERRERYVKELAAVAELQGRKPRHDNCCSDCSRYRYEPTRVAAPGERAYPRQEHRCVRVIAGSLDRVTGVYTLPKQTTHACDAVRAAWRTLWMERDYNPNACGEFVPR